ncbi:hypothetical protein PHYPSEUDO_000753 [Phytophthora pseudosyringae]|uniref:Uncharacterized protein n=1 Tax=Phytophthora pseudosyringae TaxID=221518 RepID=A0A8T1WGM0_9STRA|nr:hypothetical protein PHYPSEUDO_000753 [Phytophthora pseudosyringae]
METKPPTAATAASSTQNEGAVKDASLLSPRRRDNHKDYDSDLWETPQMARDSGAITVNYGLFINNVVRFLIYAVFFYFAVKRAMLVDAEIE